MFTFALAFLQAIDRYFSLHFQPFQLFVESGRRNLEESILNENHWPQPLHVPGAECQIDRFAAYFSSFPKKMHFKILKKNLSKPENRIPWLFTDFDNIKDFPWLFPYLEKFLFFPGFSLTVATLSQRFALQLVWLAQWIEHCVRPMGRSGFDSQSSLNFFQVISFFFHILVVHSTVTIMFTFLDNLIRKIDICCRQAWNLVQKIHRKLIPQYVTLL